MDKCNQKPVEWHKARKSCRCGMGSRGPWQVVAGPGVLRCPSWTDAERPTAGQHNRQHPSSWRPKRLVSCTLWRPGLTSTPTLPSTFSFSLLWLIEPLTITIHRDSLNKATRCPAGQYSQRTPHRRQSDAVTYRKADNLADSCSGGYANGRTFDRTVDGRLTDAQADVHRHAGRQPVAEGGYRKAGRHKGLPQYSWCVIMFISDKYQS